MMNPQRQIIQIVPKLPPAIDGLGDYALNIARQLYKDFGVKTHFVVGDPAWVGAEHPFTTRWLTVSGSAEPPTTWPAS